MALIYIVEDDANICEIESIALTNSGHEVESFENGKSFYDKLGVNRPDLIILDIMLPDEDGLEILKKLRSKPDTRRVPVILISAKSTELDRVRGLEIGADDYITKSFRRYGTDCEGQSSSSQNRRRAKNSRKRKIYQDRRHIYRRCKKSCFCQR